MRKGTRWQQCDPGGPRRERDTASVECSAGCRRGDAKLYAYDLATRARHPAKDFDTLAAAGNDDPRGVWSDGATMWVADEDDAKLYAYDLGTRVRDPAEDFDTLADAPWSSAPEGIWSDGATMWVADRWASLYAYDTTTKARDPAKDFDALAAGNVGPEGIWSDGATMWVADDGGLAGGQDAKLYAYDLATRTREPARDFDTLAAAGNDHPRGLWSDGATMWVADSWDNMLYAYAVPRRTNAPPRPNGSIPAQSLRTGGGAAALDVARYFIDPDGDPLTYGARSSRNGVVTAAVSASIVTLTPEAAGTAAVAVTATDPTGLSATQSMAVTVRGASDTRFSDDPLMPGVTRSRRSTSTSCARESMRCGRGRACRRSRGPTRC